MCFALWLWPGWHCNNTTDRSWVWFLLLSILSLGEPGNQIVHDKSAVSHLELSPNHKHEGFEPTVACRDSVRICDDQRSFQSIISPMTKSLNCSLARKIRRQDHSDRHERKKISEFFGGGHLNGFVTTDDWIEQAIIQRMSMLSNWLLWGPGLEAGLARTIENINHSLQRRQHVQNHWDQTTRDMSFRWGNFFSVGCFSHRVGWWSRASIGFNGRLLVLIITANCPYPKIPTPGWKYLKNWRLNQISH